MSYHPIHLHSEYSILDGMIQFDVLVERLKELEITACAVTDHGFLGGVVEFQKKMLKAGLKPLLGVEAYITENHDGCTQEDKIKDNAHAVIIAKDLAGLRTLFRLSSEGATKNFYYKPRISREKLIDLAGHAVVTSACLNGILAQHMKSVSDCYGVIQKFTPGHDYFDTVVDFYLKTFGEDFYLEIQDWDDETHIQSKYNEFIITLAKEKGIPLVITSDAHYLKPEDHETHEIMMAMQLGKILDEYRAGSVMRYGPHFYVKTPQEMKDSGVKWGVPEALDNTLAIAEKCNCEIPLGTYHAPVFDPKKAKDYEEFLTWKTQKQESLEMK